MHPPWRSKGRISEREAVRVLTVGFLVALCGSLSVYTLRVVEPMRAALLEHADIALVAGLSYWLYGNRRVLIVRAAMLALVGVMLLVWYDPTAAALAAVSAGAVATSGTASADAAAVAAAGLQRDDEVSRRLEQLGQGGDGSDGSGIAAAGGDGAGGRGRGGDPVPREPGDYSGPGGRRLLQVGDEAGEAEPGAAEGAAPPPPRPVPPSPAGSAARRFGAAAASRVMKQAAAVKRVFERHERSSVLLAGVVLIGAAWLNSIRRKMQQQLSADTGMSPRALHSAVLICATLTWLPIAGVRWLFSPSYAGEDAAVSAVAAGLDGSAAGEAAQAAVLSHLQPGWFAFTACAAAYGLVIFLFYENMLDLPLFSGIGAKGSAAEKSGSAPGSLPGAGVAGSKAPAGTASDTTLLRLLAMINCFWSTLSFGWTASWGYQSTWPMCFGALLFIPSVIAAAGVDWQQAQRMMWMFWPGGGGSGGGEKEDKAHGSGTWMAALSSTLEAVNTALGCGRQMTYSAEAGGYVPVNSSSRFSSSSAASLWLIRMAPSAWTGTVERVLRHILDDHNSRKIFTFLCINVGQRYLLRFLYNRTL